MICSTLLKFTLFARNTKPHVVKSTDLHCILNTNINKCRGEKLRRGKNASSSRRQWPMADPGEVPGGPPAPLIFRPNWGPKGRKRFFLRPPPLPPPFISGSGWPPRPLIWRSGSATDHTGVSPEGGIKVGSTNLVILLEGAFVRHPIYPGAKWRLTKWYWSLIHEKKI